MRQEKMQKMQIWYGKMWIARARAKPSFDIVCNMHIVHVHCTYIYLCRWYIVRFYSNLVIWNYCSFRLSLYIHIFYHYCVLYLFVGLSQFHNMQNQLLSANWNEIVHNPKVYKQKIVLMDMDVDIACICKQIYFYTIRGTLGSYYIGRYLLQHADILCVCWVCACVCIK